MIPGKFNVILDAQWGSSGKGKLSAFLADKCGVTHASSSNMPNAGHTVQFDASGNKYVSKVLPSALALNAEFGRNIVGWLSPGSSFTVERLFQELVETESSVRIHERAQLMQDKHREAEATATKHVASTMQGCAAALCEKIMRGKDVKLASSLFGTSDLSVLTPEVFRAEVYKRIIDGATWLHEVSQGYALSIDHGTHYPYCTSRNCTTQAALDQMSIPPSMLGDVYLNIRPFPIRVGNVLDADGREVGNSGPFAPYGRELTWDDVAEQAGMPDDEREKLKKNELTTVTKRLRRVGTFSFRWLKEAVRYNGVTKICLNFANYLDWDCYKYRGPFNQLSSSVRGFAEAIEDVTRVPVALVGTGPNHEDMVEV